MGALRTYNGKLLIVDGKLAVANPCCCDFDPPPGECFTCENPYPTELLEIEVTGLIDYTCTYPCYCFVPIGGECDEYLHNIIHNQYCSRMNKSYVLELIEGTCCWELNLGDLLTCDNPGLLVGESTPCQADFALHGCVKNDFEDPNNDNWLVKIYLARVYACLHDYGDAIGVGVQFIFDSRYFKNGVCQDPTTGEINSLCWTQPGNCLDSDVYGGIIPTASFCEGISYCDPTIQHGCSGSAISNVQVCFRRLIATP